MSVLTLLIYLDLVNQAAYNGIPATTTISLSTQRRNMETILYEDANGHVIGKTVDSAGRVDYWIARDFAQTNGSWVRKLSPGTVAYEQAATADKYQTESAKLFKRLCWESSAAAEKA